MDRAEIYLRAAESVATEMFCEIYGEHQCCCGVLRSQRERTAFASIFMPRGRYPCQFWFGSTKVNANRERRVLALCFAAAMARTGDL